MAEVSKNNKILKFEVSARFDEKNDQVSIFATDHDFAGLPFKVNILNSSNTHDSIISVMKDYGMEVSEGLVNKDHSNDSSSFIPDEVDYPKNPLSVENLIPLGVGDGALVHIELPDFLLIEGKPGSGKTVLMNTIIQGHKGTDSTIFYVNDRKSLEQANRVLFTHSRNEPSKSILIISDGFTDLATNEDAIVNSLHVLFNLVYSLPNAHCVFSVQKNVGDAVKRYLPFKSINMGAKDLETGEGRIISGRGFGEGLFLNGEKAEGTTEFQAYLTKKDWVRLLSE